MASGFHDGELAVQQRAGVRAQAARLSGMLAPPNLSGGASRFLSERTLAILTARDREGVLWTSPLPGARGFLEASNTTLRIHTRPATGDPLDDLPPGQPVGVLAIDFALRRRVRINGTLTAVDAGLEVAVDQAYGNCPQYIHPQPTPPTGPDVGARAVRWSEALDAAQAQLIERADTFFLGTIHAERGADASHRGGAPGFVRVEGSQLWWPDYPGNNMFNSLGNLAVDSTAALLFEDFGTGETLHLSGTAAVEWTTPGAEGDDGGTGRRVRFTPRHIVRATTSWSSLSAG
jgi:predicted pyridoxine 5'-phosphate oxidase superfamily flavin-nucleotide-binding protein